jgi:hypothetical protein
VAATAGFNFFWGEEIASHSSEPKESEKTKTRACFAFFSDFSVFFSDFLEKEATDFHSSSSSGKS